MYDGANMKEFFDKITDGFDLPLTNPVLVFSLILFIILLSPILLKRLNIPGIIGLIISGVIIGPHGFNILEKNSAVELFSTIGLLYIMFIAGLELDLNEFKSNRYKSIVFGILTFIIPFGIGVPFSYYILGYGTDATLLISCMFATQTLVAYPIVSRLGISRNQAVAITVGGTILTDTAVLIFLAVIMGSHQGNLSQDFWLQLGISIVVFLLFMFLLIPRITKWFFSKLESEKHAHYIFVLSVVFLAAFLAEAAGVEPIIGAFVAGLALNPLIPHSSALMNRIEFIGNSLFIPFFLISVGMIVDVRVLLKGPEALVIAISLTAVALFGKWIAALFTQLLFGYSKDQRNLIFGLSSSHAAAILAVILVGFKAGIIDEHVLNGTIILILITCVVASFVTEKAARRIAVSEASNENSSAIVKVRQEQILIPISNIQNIEKHLELAALIKNRKSSAPVTILSVVPNNNEAEINLLNTRQQLEKYISQGNAADIDINAIATIDHNPVSGIARTSREIMATIVILGWPKKASVLDRLIGEKIQSVINNVDKNLFITYFSKPLINHKRIVLITPPLCEREPGFETWLQKTAKLAAELQIPVVHFGNPTTHNFIAAARKKLHLNFAPVFHVLDDWEDFLILSRQINDDDLMILVSARKNSISYMSILDGLPLKLEKYFAANSRIIFFSQQDDSAHQNINYQDISAKPIEKSIEAIESLGKGIGNIFRKES